MKYDVVVVGTGPAGSTAAKYLAEHAVNVLLLDKQSFPREKPCGGGLPTRVIKRFPYVDKLIESISYGSITYSSTLKYKLTIERDRPLLAMIQRTSFDHELVKLAVEKGATFLENKQVVDLKRDTDKITVILQTGETIDAQIVIGCDGIRSVVAEKTHLVEKPRKACICIYQEIPLGEKHLDRYFTKKRMVHIFIKTLGIAGYGWVFPKKNTLNIGIGEFEPAVKPSKIKVNTKEVYEQFITLLKEKKIIPEEISTDNCKGGLLPVFPLEKTYTDRILVCGDAAGFINPITGEGIYYAMASGEIAAQVILTALHHTDTSERFLSRYQKRWKREFGKDLALLGRFNNQWGEDTEKIVRLMSRNKTFAKFTVGVTGGQLSFSRYKYLIYILYFYVSLKEFLQKKQ